MICSARSLASCLNSSLRATKSVSQLSSTMHARLGVVVDVDLDAAGLGGPAGAKLGLLEPALLGQRFGLLEVAVGFLEELPCTPSVQARSSCETR